MKTIQLTILCCLVNLHTATAQNYVAYHKLCNEAEVQIRDGQLIIAQGFLIHAMTLVPKPKAIDYFNLAKCYSQENNPDSTLKYINLALINSESMRGLVKKHYLWFEPVLGKEKWAEIIELIKNPTTRTPTKEEVAIFNVYDRMDSIRSIYQKVLYDSIYVHHSLDTTLRNLYHDSIMMKEKEASILFDSLCLANGQVPDSHPTFEYRTYFSTQNFPLSWFEKNEDFLFKELKNGRFHPGEFIRYYIWKTDGPTRRIYINRSSEITDEMIELMDKYGVTFDWNTRWLRENQSWPYE